MPKKFGINSKSLEAKAKKEERDKIKSHQKSLEKEKEDQRSWSIGARDNSKKAQEEEKKLEKLRLKKERLELEKEERKNLPELATNKNKKDQTQENYEIYAASNIDDALLLLDSSSNKQIKTLERHPERRVKAAFAIFESKELPRLREEFPSLKYSQLREKLNEKWKKSSDNPLNQTYISHKFTREQELQLIDEQNKTNLERLRL